MDELGISVCSVSGTNFAPYVKLLGGLNIPYAVLTDKDPTNDGGSLGLERIRTLLEVITNEEPDDETDVMLQAAKEHGLFLNDYTLEVDIYRCGRHKSLCTTLSELTENGAARNRATQWMTDPNTLDPKLLLKDIEAVGKGRFAQRYASRLRKDLCPPYIKDAILFLVNQCR